MSRYIPNDIKEKIIDASNRGMEDVISKFTKLLPSGANKQGECHQCGKPKGLMYSPSKNIAKCFSCDTAAASSISYLTKFEKMDFVDALLLLADQFNIDIDQPKPKKSKRKAKINAKISFCEAKLKSSGIL